jgi:exodeoxyribonuclease VII large subunit
MDEFSESQNPPPHGDNMPEMTVSELANALKRRSRRATAFVRVRGELGRVVLAKSGHLYFDIKDEGATLNTIMWKGNASKLPFKPEEGLEVVAEGRLSTYPGRSNYQMIADKLRPAGLGALMQLLEERKKKLAAEGLFAPERKKPIPFLPAVIGVVTSPTGAVIRDILHRVRDRFPVHVLIWPALVQGEKAAAEVEAGIRGFNALKVGGAIPRPDVIIVARGGGSIEDLWPFNEERVVRAVADSEIPLISAVGHETDTTLIDFVSDRRAPTPTGAAEMALPVRSELIAQVQTLGGRLTRRLTGRSRSGSWSCVRRARGCRSWTRCCRDRGRSWTWRRSGLADRCRGWWRGSGRSSIRRAAVAACGAAAGDRRQARGGGAVGGALAACAGAANETPARCAARTDTGAGFGFVRARAGAWVCAGDRSRRIACAVSCFGCGWRCAEAAVCGWRGRGDGGWRFRRAEIGASNAGHARSTEAAYSAADDGRRSGQPVLRGDHATGFTCCGVDVDVMRWCACTARGHRC